VKVEKWAKIGEKGQNSQPLSQVSLQDTVRTYVMPKYVFEVHTKYTQRKNNRHLVFPIWEKNKICAQLGLDISADSSQPPPNKTPFVHEFDGLGSHPFVESRRSSKTAANSRVRSSDGDISTQTSNHQEKFLDV